MRLRHSIPFLCVVALVVACRHDEKAAKKSADACEAEKHQLADFKGSLERCMKETGWPDDVRDTDCTVAPRTTEGLGEAESDDATPDALKIEVGGTYVLSQGRETVVMNPKPIDDGLRRFRRGATCRVDPEAKVKIVGKRVVHEEGETYDEYLVRYTREPSAEALQPGATADADALPYECPTGTVFYLDEPDLLEEDEPDPRYDEARKLLDSEKP
ncbi:MAG TPA: hypothetical protein VJ694_01110 [Patescibacteria group bacterium]|nr:hypothetical protein [Patescibacteria group bacterium]